MSNLTEDRCYFENSFNKANAVSGSYFVNIVWKTANAYLRCCDFVDQDIEMPPGHHGQEVLERTLFAKSVQSPEYLSAKQDMVTTAGTRGLDAVFEEHNLDAIFMIREGHHSLANMVGYPIGKSV